MREMGIIDVAPSTLDLMDGFFFHSQTSIEQDSAILIQSLFQTVVIVSDRSHCITIDITHTRSTRWRLNGILNNPQTKEKLKNEIKTY